MEEVTGGASGSSGAGVTAGADVTGAGEDVTGAGSGVAETTGEETDVSPEEDELPVPEDDEPLDVERSEATILNAMFIIVTSISFQPRVSTR